VFGEVFNDFKIIGSERVSEQTIINFSEVNINDDLNQNDLNNVLKRLYETNFFEDVSVNLENGILLITVKEFPIIQTIQFNGVKTKKMTKQLIDTIELKEKNPFNKFKLENDLKKMLNIFKKSGYYFVEIDVQKEINNNNTVNIIYNIEPGDKALIKKIKFIGNKKYKDRKLHSVITSEENRFWKKLTKGKYLDEQRIQLDNRLLRNFYLNKGYYNVEVKNTFSQLINEKDFTVTFNIESGLRYFFNDFEILIPDNFDESKFAKIKKVFKDLKSTPYSLRKIEKILDEIDEIAMHENYEFIDAKVSENVVDKNKLNFIFQVKESEKFYVERINIFGNNITEEQVIRNQFIIDEGDPFNVLLQNKTINNLKAKGIFSEVSYNIEDSNDINKKIINVNVEEKPTGEISAGAGYGTDGSTFTFSLSENNFQGKGIQLDTDLSISKTTIRGLFSYTNPNFNYGDRALTTSAQSTVTDKLTNNGYKTTLNKITLGSSWEQYDDLFFSPILSIGSESLTTNSSASANLKKQEGSYFDTNLYYSLSYDKRNQRFRPTAGYLSKFVQSIPIVSDGFPILNGYEFSTYKEIADEMIFSFSVYGRVIQSLQSGEDVRISKRLFIPSKRLRGFESGKIGPVDADDFVGGNYAASLNASTTVPYLLENMQNVDLKIFYDAANVWGVDYSNTIAESNKIRSSTGIAVDWLTPIGPLSFSLSQPITKASTDKTEGFRFNIGTSF